jgi:uncharacterized protein with HEPN domain
MKLTEPKSRSMKSEIRVWLEDVKLAIDETEQFLPQRLNFFEFQKDIKGRKAIERNIEIIGEAVNRILKVEPDIEITHARKIVDARNRIIHGYDTISEDIIWTIATFDLKKLKKEIDRLIDE